MSETRKIRVMSRTAHDHSAVYCSHANECPTMCPCDARCYCKSHTCRDTTTVDGTVPHVLEIEAKTGATKSQRSWVADLDSNAWGIFDVGTDALVAVFLERRHANDWIMTRYVPEAFMVRAIEQFSGLVSL